MPPEDMMGADDNQVPQGWWQQCEGHRLLHGGSSVAQANVYVASWQGQQVLVKTFRDHPVPIRATWGRWVLRRECRLLTRLDDVQGIPSAIGFDEREAVLATYFVPGARALVCSRELSPREYPPLEFFDQLRKVLGTMHQHGVAHGDIRRKNILIDSDGRPYIIDFATAVERSSRRLSPSRLAYRMCVRADLFSILKIQHSYYPESLSADDSRHIFERPWYVSLGRFLRRNVYKKFIKQKHWRERLRRIRKSSVFQEAVSFSSLIGPGREAESIERKVNSR